MPCAMPNAKAVGEVRRPIAGKWMRSCNPSAKVAGDRGKEKNDDEKRRQICRNVECDVNKRATDFQRNLCKVEKETKNCSGKWIKKKAYK